MFYGISHPEQLQGNQNDISESKYKNIQGNDSTRMNLWFIMSSFSIHERRSDHLSFQLEPFLLDVAITLQYVHFDFASWNLYAFDLKRQRN